MGGLPKMLLSELPQTREVRMVSTCDHLNTVDDVLKDPQKSLLRIPGFGPSSLGKFKATIEESGFDISDWSPQ